MAKIKNFIMSGAILMAGGMLGTSCNDWLDLGPIDSFGSGNYWSSEANVESYVDGIHKNLRDKYWEHSIVFGEQRGGHWINGLTCDGSSAYWGDVVGQNFDQDHTGVSNFADYYGRITNINNLLANIDNISMNVDKKNYFKGIAYGLRAFYYFDLHRIFGGVPLREGIEVIQGELDPIKLYKARATPAQTLEFIKKDIQASLDAFGSQSGFGLHGTVAKKYWSKAATECLAAEVYLWSGKASLNGYLTPNAADLQIAKTYLNNVINNYGLSMLGDFAAVFDAKKKAHSEIIMAIHFAEGEATNNNAYWTYSCDTGSTQANSYREDGSRWNDPLGLKKGNYMAAEYKQGVFNMFDEEDSRKDATFLANYRKNDAGELYVNGTHVVKNIGYINSNGDRVYCGDYILYRLAWVYLSLAEIANYEGDGDAVETYINKVRERAYGENWDKAKFGYVKGDFTQNELAIFNEKTKEFIQEGQRWWDLIRMTSTKGGDPLVFDVNASFEDYPVLNKATEAHKILWPINVGVLNNDTTILQTPGYGAGSQKECAW